MKNLKLISGVSATLLSCAFGNFVAKAGPVRPTIKSVVFKMVGGSQVKPYDLNSEQRKLWKTTGSSRISRSPSPSDINPNDGQLPSTSSSSLSSLVVVPSTSSFPSTSSENLPSTSSDPSATFQIPGIKRNVSSIVLSVTSEGKVYTRRTAKASTLQAGEAIYRMTRNRKGEMLPEVGTRPHVIIHAQESRTKAGHTEIFIADMTKTKGKEQRLIYPQNYLLDVNDPNFSGDDSGFVKLNTFTRVTLKNNKRYRLLGKIINDRDLSNIRRITGFEK